MNEKDKAFFAYFRKQREKKEKRNQTEIRFLILSNWIIHASHK